MKTLIISILILLLASMFCHAQEKLQCLNVDFKVRGYFYAGTSFSDTSALGGFGRSSNNPLALQSPLSNYRGIVVQAIQDDTSILIAEDGKKFKGISVLIINATNKTTAFDAQDSRLNMVCQAYYKGSWVDLEYLPSSWCGNSYHKIYLDKEHYWRFTAPCYTGSTPAKLRFQLTISEGKHVYSNEIEGAFNPKALKQQQGHKGKSLMDPYDN
jgi:hypothetical protein